MYCCIGEKLLNELCAVGITHTGRYPAEELIPCPDNERNRLLKMFDQFLPDAVIISVLKINNTFSEKAFLLKKEEYLVRYKKVEQLELYHATSKNILDAIALENLNWRKIERHRYGFGVSFSPNMDYANFYCNRRNKSQRAMIVCNVLVSNPTEGHYSLKVPQGLSDTSVSQNRFTFVKYNDNEFMPTYAILYLCPNIVLKNSKFKCFDSL